MEMRGIFSGLQQQLEGHFSMSAHIQHPGGKGARRKSAIRRLFQDYLPRRYSCGTGTLVSITGRSSYQCDIVIHDDFHQPLLLQSEDHATFAADAVFGVIEAKSTLSAEQLQNAYENIQAAKVTADRTNFFGGILASLQIGASMR